MPIGMLGIYRLLFVTLFVYRDFVTHISDVGWRRAMKFGRMIDWVGSRSFPLLVNFGPVVNPQGQKVKIDNALDTC